MLEKVGRDKHTQILLVIIFDPSICSLQLRLRSWGGGGGGGAGVREPLLLTHEPFALRALNLVGCLGRYPKKSKSLQKVRIDETAVIGNLELFANY